MSESTPLLGNSQLPLYEQLMQHLRAAILTGQYEEGAQLPPESELCEQYGVSRITARRALLELVNEGLLERRQGKGTFVAPKKMTIRVMSLDGFAGFRRDQPGAEMRILKKEIRKPTAKEAAMLEIEEDVDVYELDRVLELEGIALSLDRAVYSAGRFPGLLDKVDENTSTYELMDTVFHHRNHHFSKEIVITTARPEEALAMRCPTGELLYLVTKIMYDCGDVPNHVSFNLIRACHVKLVLNHTRD